MENHTRTVFFHETQRFTQWWIWLLILIAPAIVIYAMYQQFILGKPFGSNPASDLTLAILGIIFGLSLPLFLRLLNLRTEVRSDGIFIRYFPLHLRGKLIRFDEISSFYARQYRPIREYGGWGIRVGRGGTAYNVSGNQGLQLELKDGKRILIGSQKSGEFARAVAQASGRQPTGPK